ncbi:anti-sigma factor [Leptospira perolatii]|uniref:Anti-sigma factor n=1 Tax=Leptospira perolatii TaxID=2023191 RepID=A0A2M9ZHY3_9LEPT|nr:ATP-binding protein [Leptospira perolatii]PJZ68026.1 anti-sigma factor [Leptospira perolatii]PJZ71665.1 anti-sigma factor [Leptospira perolatii]
MDSKSEKILKIRTDLSELSRVRSEIREFLGKDCSDITRNRILLSLDESVTNVIEHGFPEPKESEMELRMKKNKASWRFTITDEGILFDPTKHKSSTWKDLYESGADGGFGIRSVKKIMLVRYKQLSNPPRNKLTLIYKKGKND